ncbi:uncharacterized protein TNCT_148741 [Trichonephila clavata]|uniref:Uncharacterized protein n=1 Tax=Trichonephila clavata TaxID=2740835 RepID=A0A8X6HBJ2_TRICU|nr:uncharacterized protein TNCT_148741 [Trichonephila clavata]
MLRQNFATRSRQYINEVYSFNKRKVIALSNEYYCKVTHDFSCYVYFGKSDCHNESRDEAINLITSCFGYEAHRMINHKNQTTHFYIRLANPDCAQEAVARIKQAKRDYVADTVDKILLGWYLLEMTSGTFPWTLAIVDVFGRVEHTNPLSQDVLQSMLFNFGDPRIHSYQDRLGGFRHVQVLFSSMSEALGASIAFGCWYRKMNPVNPRFYYRLRILSSNKEVCLLKKCVDRPLNQTDDDLEALDLDYFVPKVSDVNVSYQNPDMHYQDANTNFMTQAAISEGFEPRYRTFRRQYSRSRGNNARNRMKTSEGQRNARQQNSRNAQSENIPSAGLVSDFLMVM